MRTARLWTISICILLLSVGLATCGGSGGGQVNRELRRGPDQDTLDAVIQALDDAESYEVSIEAETPYTSTVIEYADPGIYRLRQVDANGLRAEEIWSTAGSFYYRNCDDGYVNCASWEGAPGDPSYWNNAQPPIFSQQPWLTYPGSAAELIKQTEDVAAGEASRAGEVVLTGTVNPARADRALTPPTPTNGSKTPFDQEAVNAYDDDPLNVVLVASAADFRPLRMTLSISREIQSPFGTLSAAEVKFSRFDEVALAKPSEEELQRLGVIGVADDELSALGIRLELPPIEVTYGLDATTAISVSNNKLHLEALTSQAAAAYMYAPERGVADGQLVWVVNYDTGTIKSHLSPTPGAGQPRFLLSFVDVETNAYLFSVAGD